MKPIGFIYLTTNLVDGKIYIGQHEFLANKKKNASYLGSGLFLLRAIKKYGRENFTRKILKICYSNSELNYWEFQYIKQYNSTDSNIGYNIAEGDVNTNGNPMKSEIVRKKLSEKYIGAGNPMYGKHWSENKRKQMMEMFSKNHPFKGKHHSEETKKRWSELRRGKDPFVNLSAEHKERIFKKLRGKNNPMYGSRFIWINNGVNNKRHNPEEEIPAGFSIGYIKLKK